MTKQEYMRKLKNKLEKHFDQVAKDKKRKKKLLLGKPERQWKTNYVCVFPDYYKTPVNCTFAMSSD